MLRVERVHKREEKCSINTKNHLRIIIMIEISTLDGSSLSLKILYETNLYETYFIWKKRYMKRNYRKRIIGTVIIWTVIIWNVAESYF